MIQALHVLARAILEPPQKEERHRLARGVGRRVGRVAAAGICLLAALAGPGQALASMQPLCTTAKTCPDGNPVLVHTGINGGKMLAHPEVIPIFWGLYWVGGDIQPGQIVGGVQAIVGGPYTAALSQYGEVGPARMAPFAPVDLAPIPNGFLFSDLEVEINALIGRGAIPQPAVGHDRVYTVFLPPGTVSGDNPSPDIGYNQPGTCDASCGSGLSGTTYTAIAVYPGSPTALQAYTASFSHEFAEAITEGIVFNCGPTGGGQVADLCECDAVSTYPGDYMVVPYWSAENEMCVIPEAWSNILQYNGTPGSWTTIGNDAFLVSSGVAGLYSVFKGNTLQSFNGTTGKWTNIGFPSGLQGASMIAAGASDLMMLDAGGNAAFRRDKLSGQWTQLPPLAGGFSGVAAGAAMDIVTDSEGDAWQLASNTWSSVGAQGDQFVVGSDWVASINMTREVVLYANGGSSTIDTDATASELYIGGLQTLAARQDGLGDLIAMTTSWNGNSYVSHGWVDLAGPADSVGLYGYTGAPLVMTDTKRANTYQETTPIVGIEDYGESASWPRIGGSIMRLVGGGPTLYAVAGITY